MSLPRGLPGFIARMAASVANPAERKALPFHEAASGLFIADLHADTLLWGFDPIAPRSGGHIDGPRLAASGVSLQIFAAPTWTPLPVRRSDARLVVSERGFDQSHALFPTGLFGFGGRRRRQRKNRALRIARRFDELTEASQHRLAPWRAVRISGAADLAKLTPRGAGRPEIGVLLALEGLHWLRRDDDDSRICDEVETLHHAGYRMLAPTHRFSNGLGGSNEDRDACAGLTPAGRRFVRCCLERRIALDLAHASPALVREACGIALTQDDGPRPVILSHCGVREVHPSPRNLSAADIRSVASTGGLIGIGFWRGAMGWRDDEPFGAKMQKVVMSFAAALRILQAPEFAEEMGGRFGRYDPYEHLAFGSDFDGAVTTAFDVTGVSHVIAALAAAQRDDGAPLFPREKLALIAGENARRVLSAALG